MIQALQFILSLSILIVLHEMGHFIPAKLFKTRVEKFYLFFDPWFSLFKFKKGETEYGIGWLPLGGYVKISGMIDESMDKEQMKKPAEPWEFRSKPAWQRLIIMVGGVTVNVILGFLIYSMVLFTWGQEYLPTKNMKYGIACDSLALKMGLKDGDKILSVDNIEVENSRRIAVNVILDQAKTIQVERDGQKIEIPVSDDDIANLIRAQSNFIVPRIPTTTIDSIIKDNPAEKAGLMVGDKILSINGNATNYFHEVQKNIHGNKDKKIDIKVLRKNDTVLASPTVTADGTIGIGIPDPKKFFEIKTVSYGFFESFPAGAHEVVDKVQMQLKQFRIMFTVKDAHKSIGGFMTMGKIFSPEWDWPSFWTLTAFLSIVLAVMNILPIPALDGGHVMFLLYEVITRRKPNEKVMEYSQYAGMLLLLALLLYANGNDVIKNFFK